jgi:hypothetical protein
MDRYYDARVCSCAVCVRAYAAAPLLTPSCTAQVEQGPTAYDYGLFKRFLYQSPGGPEHMITAGWATSIDVFQEGVMPWPSVCLGLSASCRKDLVTSNMTDCHVRVCAALCHRSSVFFPRVTPKRCRGPLALCMLRQICLYVLLWILFLSRNGTRCVSQLYNVLYARVL